MSDYIRTYTGKKFYPLAPRAEDVDIVDIAHALSMKCRFTGHTREFYSVAQHSFYVSELCKPPHKLWGLMHDAAEAYLPDVATPVKNQIPHFREIEDKVLRVIASAIGLEYPMPPDVKKWDSFMLSVEKRDLMLCEDPCENMNFPFVQSWRPDQARSLFVSTFQSLCEVQV